MQQKNKDNTIEIFLLYAITGVAALIGGWEGMAYLIRTFGQ